MGNAYGIQFNDQYGEAPFQYGDVIADIADAALAAGVGAEFWLDNVNGRAKLSQTKGNHSYMRVITVRSDTLNPTQEEISWLVEHQMPILKIAFPKGLYRVFYPTSFETAYPFEGRQWASPTADCYRLFLDYYRKGLNIPVPSVAAPSAFVFQDPSYGGENLFLTSWEPCGFQQVISPQHGDVLLMRTGSMSLPGPDHIAMYQDGGKILHHYKNRLSTIQDYAGIWRSSTTMILRHNSLI